MRGLLLSDDIGVGELLRDAVGDVSRERAAALGVDDGW